MSSTLIWSDKTGLENVTGIMDGSFPAHDRLGKLLNLKLVEVSKGKCTYEGKTNKDHLNPRGTVHGGWVMSILDAAAVVAVVTALPKGVLSATSTFEVKFTRPLPAGTLYRAEGEVVSIGKHLAHAKANLFHVETGKLVAFCTCSASLYNIDD